MAEYHLTTPISEDLIRKLRVGDVVYVSGIVVTARDKAHKLALEKGIPEDLARVLDGGVVYHCGPVVSKRDGEWVFVSAGPTTSARMEPLEPEFIRRFRVRIIVGKGGMGQKTLEALKKFGAVYCSFPGGCGALAAQAVERVEAVYFLEELGVPEAFWVLRVREFGPLLVTMDSHGGSIHAVRSEEVKRALEKVLAEV